jgi:hypothetical protein
MMEPCCTSVSPERGQMSWFCPADPAVSTTSSMTIWRLAGCGHGIRSPEVSDAPRVGRTTWIRRLPTSKRCDALQALTAG